MAGVVGFGIICVLYAAIAYIFYNAVVFIGHYYNIRAIKADDFTALWVVFWPISIVVVVVALFFVYCIMKPIQHITPKVSEVRVDSSLNFEDDNLYPLELLNYLKSLENTVLNKMFYGNIKKEDRSNLINFLLTIGYKDRGDGLFVKMVFGGIKGDKFKKSTKEALQ